MACIYAHEDADTAGHNRHDTSNTKPLIFCQCFVSVVSCCVRVFTSVALCPSDLPHDPSSIVRFSPGKCGGAGSPNTRLPREPPSTRLEQIDSDPQRVAFDIEQVGQRPLAPPRELQRHARSADLHALDHQE